MVRKILKHPNKLLRREALKVVNFKRLSGLFWDLKETLKVSKGVGLAAPQIGVNQRVLVAKVVLASGSPAVPVLFVNPVITSYEPELGTSEEACLSVPGMAGTVQRYKEIRLEYQDIDGNIKNAILVDEEAFILQHEIDHLDGVLYIDRIEEQNEAEETEE